MDGLITIGEVLDGITPPVVKMSELIDEQQGEDDVAVQEKV